jgi:hypothetical protein
MALARQKEDVRALIAREEGAFATLTVNKDVDAFMMRIGHYIIVEFSKKPNACYIYDADNMKFDRNSRRYTGGTDDLKYGYYDRDAASIRHLPHWQISGASTLAKLGILPDLRMAGSQTVNAQRVPHEGPPKQREAGAITGRGASTTAMAWLSSRQVQSSPTPASTQVPIERDLKDSGSESAALPRPPRCAKFTMPGLQYMIGKSKSAHIIDGRKDDGSGRLWVSNPQRGRDLDRWLESNGFKWSERSVMWYFPE